MGRSKRRNFTHNVRLCVCPDCKADYAAGERMAEVINASRTQLCLEEFKQSWWAFKLEDGTWDRCIYDSKRAAVRGQLNEFQCVYICGVNLIGGAKPHECAIFLNFTRDAYDAGFRLPDPDSASGGADVVPTAPQMDAMRGRVRAILSPEMQLLQGMN